MSTTSSSIAELNVTNFRVCGAMVQKRMDEGEFASLAAALLQCPSAARAMPKRSSAQRNAGRKRNKLLKAALEAEGKHCGATSMVSPPPGLSLNPLPAVAVPPVTAPPAVAEGWTLGPPFVPVGGPHPPEMQVWEAEPQHVNPPNETHLVVVDGISNDGEEPRWILSEPISADRYFVRVLTQKRLAQLIGTRFRIFSEDIDDKGITSWVLLEHETRFCVVVEGAILIRPVYHTSTWPMVYQ